MNGQKQEKDGVPHNIIIEGRSKMILSGILDVESFEEDNVALKTTGGNLTIRGNNMRMESYLSEVGDLVIYGNFYALVYLDDSVKKEGFISRIFR